MNEKKMTDPKEIVQFILAGNATFTLRSVVTGARYTYKVSEAKWQEAGGTPLWFVGLLAGPDNESDYQYIGIISNKEFRLTGKSRHKADALPVKGFVWAWKQFVRGVVPPDSLEFWHEGRCGRCGRTLTVPESIESGYGPECITLVRGMAA